MNKQDRQVLRKAKYCPRVAAVSRTWKHTENPCNNRLLEVVEVNASAKFHRAKCSGSCVINNALDFGQL